MIKSVKAYAATSASTPLVFHPITRRQRRPDDVEIDILYCGVCHSDLHTARNDWGWSSYPIVPGHEIIGQVVAVGEHVTRFKVGDRVGVGCMVDSCGHCEACQEGHEQHCAETATYTYGAIDRIDGSMTQGGYSEKVVVKQDFVVSIPDNLDLRGAAPLLCAGITTWSPLKNAKVGPGSRVAVVGLGGLGHMAIKLAKALGADVTLFTRSSGKEEDAYRLGADRVVISTDAEQMAQVAGHFHLIVDTVPYVHDVNAYIPTLRFNGSLVLVGYLGPLDPTLNTMPMVIGGKAVAASMIGGIAATQEMLDFCGEHNIVSDVEVIRMQDINEAYERMLNSDVKYRFVIDMASLNAQD
ncbi:Alcohol dehydrogenase GroES domain protein [Dickeya parazeae Ech586]|uniref:Alcohol dehydrogenase GroES domain protein n=1 Tax=Dickeya zeae (strain Ech586) TaxID=590409 RepID=D2BVX2_DICZ5|nr:NAD(P)-dependent alcohol dehydrogenase [Dickeya parazeae]ACZ78256.1 Alcohol dehydrogenase GroES domain protein [Dickeya parazeae Ech586]